MTIYDMQIFAILRLPPETKPSSVFQKALLTPSRLKLTKFEQIKSKVGNGFYLFEKKPRATLELLTMRIHQ